MQPRTHETTKTSLYGDNRTAPDRSTTTCCPETSHAKSAGSSATTGNDFPYITSATIDASAKNESTPVVSIAAGAVPARTASSNTAVVVDEPLLNGTARMVPAAWTPTSGWCASMIVPVLKS